MSHTNRFGQEVIDLETYTYRQEVQDLLEGKEVDEIGFDMNELCVTFEDGSVLQVHANPPGLEVLAGTPDG